MAKCILRTTWECLNSGGRNSLRKVSCLLQTWLKVMSGTDLKRYSLSCETIGEGRSGLWICFTVHVLKVYRFCSFELGPVFRPREQKTKTKQLNAMVTLHGSAVWSVPNACAQPYIITQDAAMDSCFSLLRAHQHGMAFNAELGDKCPFKMPCHTACPDDISVWMR